MPCLKNLLEVKQIHLWGLKMGLNEKHAFELDALRQRYMQQINLLKKQLESEEARLRSRHADEIKSQHLRDKQKAR